MTVGNTLRLAAALVLPLAACGGNAAPTPQVMPNLQLRPNPVGPGYISPCAGGMPSMQYNCPQGQN